MASDAPIHPGLQVNLAPGSQKLADAGVGPPSVSGPAVGETATAGVHLAGEEDENRAPILQEPPTATAALLFSAGGSRVAPLPSAGERIALLPSSIEGGTALVPSARTGAGPPPPPTSGGVMAADATEGETALSPSARWDAALLPPTSITVAGPPLTPEEFARLLPLVLEHINTNCPATLSGLPPAALSGLPPTALSGLQPAAFMGMAAVLGQVRLQGRIGVRARQCGNIHWPVLPIESYFIII